MEQECPEEEGIGTYTWSHPDRIRKSGTSKRSSVRRKINQPMTDDFGQECTLETYLHHIIFIGMKNELEVTDMPHKNDDQNAQEPSDFAARFWPGCWIFVGRSLKNTGKHDIKVNRCWDRRALRILGDFLVILSLFCSQPNNPQTRYKHTEREKDSIHFNASTESRSTIYKLIESQTCCASPSRSRRTWMTGNRETSCSNQEDKEEGTFPSTKERPLAGNPTLGEKDAECDKEIFQNTKKERIARKQVISFGLPMG